MRVGDLVRNIHTVRGGEADEHGIIVDDSGRINPIYQRNEQGEFKESSDRFNDQHVKVMWFPKGLVEYMTWMDTDDLEVINETR